MNVLDLLREDGFQPELVASTRGGEYKCPCPACGGEDRFWCHPNEGVGGKYYCRVCGKKGDINRYLMDFRGYSFGEACTKTGVKAKLINKPRFNKQPRIWIPQSSKEAPTIEWQEEAKRIVFKGMLKMDGVSEIGEWLEKRGLGSKTIREARLGWITPKLGKELGIHSGLLIPHIKGQEIFGIRIRRFKPKAQAGYTAVKGSRFNPMVLGSAAKGFVVVESDLDAWLIHQEAGDLVTVVSLGSAQNRPDSDTTHRLRKAQVVLIALDFDDAGKNETVWWIKNFPNSTQWPVPKGKDPGEAFQAGVDIRKWILAGLPPNLQSGFVPSVDLNNPPPKGSLDHLLWKLNARGVNLDGRIVYPKIEVGTVTGRITYKGVTVDGRGLQQLPKNVRCTKIQPLNPDHTIVRFDYGQIEPRILHHLLTLEGLIDFEPGEDLYRTLIDTDLYNRDQVKVIVNKIINGGHVDIQPEGRLAEFVDGVRRFSQLISAQALFQGYVTTLSRRKIKIDPAEPNFMGKCVNRIVQGTAADIFNNAAILVNQSIEDESLDAAITFLLFDELWVEMEQNYESTLEMVKYSMSQATENLKSFFPIKVDFNNYLESKGDTL